MELNLWEKIQLFLGKSSSHSLHDHQILPDVLTILIFAIGVVLLFKKLRLSPVIGYIAAGAIIGPYGLQLAGYNDVTKSLAEFGVVFLLFTIGLELTLERLMQMKKLIFGLGTAQFFVTSIIFGIITYGITNNFMLALVISTSLSLSSTAIVLKVLAETHQANTTAGKSTLSMLLFQDLAVVPLFILIPLLSQGQDFNFFSTMLSIGVKSFLALAVIILFGRYLLSPAFHVIVSSKHDDLFIATSLLIVLSAAWITNHLGLSLALGAFMAGVMIAETEFQHQVKSAIEPFKGLFLGFFFITEVGMQFDLRLIISNFSNIFIMAMALIFIKAIIVIMLCLIFKQKLSTSINTGLLISQAGEFAFVLFEMAKQNSIMDELMFQNLSIVVGLSMALSPLLASMGQKIENKLSVKDHNKNDDPIPFAHNQVIIAGYGRVGRTVSRILDNEGIKYIAIERDTNLVKKFFKKRIPIYYGEITELKFLKSLNPESAAAVILCFNDLKEIEKAAKLMVKHFPNTPLIVRAMDTDHYQELKKIGAKHVIPEMQELSFQISKNILTIMGETEKNADKMIDFYRENELNSYLKSK